MLLPWATSVWLFLYFTFGVFSMFLVKPVSNRTFFFWKPQRVLLCCITTKPENFFPCTGHSPRCHLLSSAPKQREKFGFCPERTLPSKNTLSRVAGTVLWDSQFPFQCLSHGRDLLAFTPTGFVSYFRAGRWEIRSQRNLSHCNLVLVLVREEGVYFLPLHPSQLEGLRS